jgi:hypothetical protein
MPKAAAVAAPEIPPAIRSQFELTLAGWTPVDPAAALAMARQSMTAYGESGRLISGASATEQAVRELSGTVDLLQIDAPLHVSGSSPLFSSVLLSQRADAASTDPAALENDGRWEAREWFAADGRARTWLLTDGSAFAAPGAGRAMDALAWASTAAGVRTVIAGRGARDAFGIDTLLAKLHEGIAHGTADLADALRAAEVEIKKSDPPPSAWAGLRVVLSSLGGQDVAVSVNDARPLAKAIDVLEQRYAAAITYEDPPYAFARDLKDVSNEVRRDAPQGKPRVIIPAGGVFEAQYVEPSDPVPPNLQTAVRRVVAKYNASGLAGEFQVVEDGALLHVVPMRIRNRLGVVENQRSLLDTKLTIDARDRSALEMLQAFVEALTQASGSHVSLGTVPLNLLAQTRVSGGANDERAGTILMRTLAATGATLSWRLFYGPEEARPGYALNVHMLKTTR